MMRVRLLLSALVLLVGSTPGAALIATPGCRLPGRAPSQVRMGPAQDGPFTPVCLAGKVVLGQTTFNKYRGKIISYHSGIIGDFCDDYGVPRNMKAAMIKKAKIVGGQLGFLS